MAGVHEDPPSLRIVRGEPTDDEIAALTAVLASISTARAAGSQRGDTSWSVWAEPAARLRHVPTPGPAAWRTSALPR
jgi:hypothetical protein